MSLKFCVAEREPYDHEETLLEFLETQKRDPSVTHPGKHFLIDLLDTFKSQSPNGIHSVIVTNVTIPLSLVHPTSEPSWGLAAWQLTSALSFIHSKSIAHLDVHIQNVGCAVTMTDELVAKLPAPEINLFEPRGALEADEHCPRETYPFSTWQMWANRTLAEFRGQDLRVQLLDFGKARSQLLEDTRTNAYAVYPAPETRLGYEDALSLAPSIDIWCLSQLLFGWEYEWCFFDDMLHGNEGRYARRLRCIAGSLDGLPERWRARTEEAMVRDERHRLEEEPEQAREGLNRCCCEAPELGEFKFGRDLAGDALVAMNRHVEEFWEFFQKAATIDPESRPSAQEMLQERYVSRHQQAATEGMDGDA